MDALIGNAGDQPVVRLRNLAFGYPGDKKNAVVLEGLDLDVHHGEFVTLVGQSGAGKSTLLRVIAGLVPPIRGDVEVEPVKEPGSRPLSLVFQDARLLPWRTVIANIEYGLEGLIKSKTERRQRASEALALVGLTEYANRWPHQLSGGQRQRIGLARAFAVRPKLLLMDEPFGALDPVTRQMLQDELLTIWRATQTSIIFVTHDIDEATYLADRVILLGGRPAHILKEFTVDTPRPRVRGHIQSDDIASTLRTTVYEAFSVGSTT